MFVYKTGILIATKWFGYRQLAIAAAQYNRTTNFIYYSKCASISGISCCGVLRSSTLVWRFSVLDHQRMMRFKNRSRMRAIM